MRLEACVIIKRKDESAMRYVALLVLLLAPLPATAYPEWIAPQRASEAAGQRGDWASACRHAINAAFAMNQYNQFNSTYMEYVGKTCIRAGRSG